MQVSPAPWRGSTFLGSSRTTSLYAQDGSERDTSYRVHSPTVQVGVGTRGEGTSVVGEDHDAYSSTDTFSEFFHHSRTKSGLEQVRKNGLIPEVFAADIITECLRLCEVLGLAMQSEISAPAFFSKKDAQDLPSHTSIGVTLNGCMINNCLVGGPAFNSRKLDAGDVITTIDGMHVNASTIFAALVGDDVPGSKVTLDVHKKYGDRLQVQLERVPSIELVDARKMAELLQALKKSAMRLKYELSSV